ncbi:MAG TPA: methionine adenosyltransferase [Candidatus Dormibacteraeota bacterium]|nr:methionine adenosyltransferase [Candidatus Dormibacteraeota bacterium]
MLEEPRHGWQGTSASGDRGSRRCRDVGDHWTPIVYGRSPALQEPPGLATRAQGPPPSPKSRNLSSYEPRSRDDIPELRRLVCNDTSLGYAFAPNTRLESLVLELEDCLIRQREQRRRRWIGSDIKIMAFRTGLDVKLTIAMPQIAEQVPNLNAYRENIDCARDLIRQYCSENYPEFSVQLSINTRDDYGAVELYLTATGSSIESGDEGTVGRGNRIGGLITACRPYTMEGICGKNPVYRKPFAEMTDADRVYPGDGDIPLDDHFPRRNRLRSSRVSGAVQQ